ncbi:DNA-directed RNA polymerase II subunit RPB4 [Cryptococcus deuterogattii LA55]|nr:DNA-directed RNA polymerase II subunit RPB4 [Cryptococcus deuterogattii LA55]KIR33168.1 DNA-directed RNA polymerase II subunit RPB4 [Cryptococcus deuterogattii MMRL2647]KIR72312.1 DNA-directed RNA polymerase II subunit RPB4 [Cryptococcus deuterogattii CA1014]KIR91902.1 DNA-directed RNA polymerase II subunit RPB4 [Cryptococcus deuterogattii CBS 10090]KIR97714.1 DNA-directed RNA polymerase II subunit RPB4 [Cryptococcus deuterogattii 2001/935-1]
MATGQHLLSQQQHPIADPRLHKPCLLITAVNRSIQEEDATKLQFGDFAEGEALTLTEVATLLKAARQAPNVPPAPDNKYARLCLPTVSALSARHGFLNKFEIAQIMSLRPERVEVAVALIPSLERYAQGDENEAQLQSLLDDVRSMVRYGVQP